MKPIFESCNLNFTIRFPGKLTQYHSYWYPVNLSRQVISSSHIDYLKSTDHFFPRGKLSTPCPIPMIEKTAKCIYCIYILLVKTNGAFMRHWTRDHHWFQIMAYCSTPSHFLNQCWFIANWTIRENIQANFNRNHWKDKTRLQNGGTLPKCHHFADEFYLFTTVLSETLQQVKDKYIALGKITSSTTVMKRLISSQSMAVVVNVLWCQFGKYIQAMIRCSAAKSSVV